MNTLLLAEDDPLHLRFLRGTVIAAAEFKGWRILEALDGAAACDILGNEAVSAAVVDLQLPNKTGIEVAKALWSGPSAASPLLFWSNYGDEAYVRSISRWAPSFAVFGYLLKTATADRLVRTMVSVFFDRQRVIDGEVRGLINRLEPFSERLSERELQTLHLVCLGLTDEVIARSQGISLRSAQLTLQHLYEKLETLDQIDGPINREQFNRRVRTVSIALRRGIINAKTLEMAERAMARQGTKR
jgi:DNA-binding NarL/FixJ family response regulator